MGKPRNRIKQGAAEESDGFPARTRKKLHARALQKTNRQYRISANMFSPDAEAHRAYAEVDTSLVFVGAVSTHLFVSAGKGSDG